MREAWQGARQRKTSQGWLQILGVLYMPSRLQQGVLRKGEVQGDRVGRDPKLGPDRLQLRPPRPEHRPRMPRRLLPQRQQLPQRIHRRNRLTVSNMRVALCDGCG